MRGNKKEQAESTQRWQICGLRQLFASVSVPRPTARQVYTWHVPGPGATI
jgi:hypothetical protein